jgi:antitoxin component of MazEF toxin-antitoxin module
MERKQVKIQKNGPRGLCVLLPADYINENGLRAGDVVELIRTGAKLVIKTKKERGI